MGIKPNKWILYLLGFCWMWGEPYYVQGPEPSLELLISPFFLSRLPLGPPQTPSGPPRQGIQEETCFCVGYPSPLLPGGFLLFLQDLVWVFPLCSSVLIPIHSLLVSPLLQGHLCYDACYASFMSLPLYWTVSYFRSWCIDFNAAFLSWSAMSDNNAGWLNEGNSGGKLLMRFYTKGCFKIKFILIGLLHRNWECLAWGREDTGKGRSQGEDFVVVFKYLTLELHIRDGRCMFPVVPSREN